jgi:hypothetical protein
MADNNDRACGAACGSCRDCNPTHAMAERMDAWKSADSLLMKDSSGNRRKWGAGDEEVIITPTEVLLLANWLLYGPDEGDD